MFFIDLAYQSGERFDMGKLMEFTDTHDPLNSYFLARLTELPSAGYYVISGEEKRPDLIAAAVYGNVQYWWLLLWYNDIVDIEELVVGQLLEYPSMVDIEKLFYDLRALEVAKS